MGVSLSTVTAQVLHSTLTLKPGLTVRELLRIAGLPTQKLYRSAANSILYRMHELFYREGSQRPMWYAIPQKLVDPPPKVVYVGPTPFPWQLEAFDAWKEAGQRGIVEAVTGTGKTTVGILAACEAVKSGSRVLVVVPGIEVLNQWYTKLVDHTRGVVVGRLGNGYCDNYLQCDVLVGAIQSASQNLYLDTVGSGLIVVDEVHRAGAAHFSSVLNQRFDYRLGLTATLERSDGGVEEYLTPYFVPRGRHGSAVVAGCSYERGLTDQIIAPFHVALVAVPLPSSEMAEYREHDGVARETRGKLIRNHDVPASPLGDFMMAVNKLSEGGHADGVGTKLARRYMHAFSQRRQLLANSSSKLEKLDELLFVLRRSNGALLFTETKKSTYQAADRLNSIGLSAHAFTSDLDTSERARLLKEFKNHDFQALCAPRVLDEGVDVPEADLGIIVAASRSRRQMIQRMGRLIRPKSNGRPARFILLYAEGTLEDPATGAQESFLGEMSEVAASVHKFTAGAGRSDFVDWFKQTSQNA